MGREPDLPDGPAELELAQTATAGDGQAPAAGDRLGRGDVLGRYTIVDTLGEGGMGVVYGAYDPDLDRKVALKLLRVAEGGSASDSARARLLREARATAKLSHANVIRVYEVGTVGETDFMAMEFIDGTTLAAWLEAEHTWDEVVRIFAQAGRGLAAAHHAGLIHRDFKPANVLLGSDGRVLVTDFGLARVNRDARPLATGGAPASTADDPALTRTGTLLGTPAYMAPEQFAGGTIDERSDQFSFCVALYQGVYGERPFAGETLEDLQVAVTGGHFAPEPRTARVPSWLRKVLLRGLSTDPADRHPSMDALLVELRGRDPGRLKRRLAAGGVLSITAAAVIYAVSGGGAGGGAAAAACGDGEDSFAGVWDSPRREAVEPAFDRAGVPFDAFAAVLDGYKDAWKRAFVASCRAARVDRTRTDEEHTLVSTCLFSRRDRAASLVSLFEGADVTVLDNAVAAAQKLPAIEACNDIAELRKGLKPPADPATRELVDRLRADLRDVAALQTASQYARALEPALEAADAARDIDYEPARAEALYRLGRVLFFLDRPAGAREALEEGLLLAEASGHDEYRARILVAQFLVEVQFNSDDRVSRRLARHARAAVERWGQDDALLARIENGLAQLEIEEARFDSALAKLEVALAIYRRAGAGELQIARQRQRIAHMKLMDGDLGGARRDLEDTLRIQRDALGDLHPRVASSREELGSVLRAQRQFDAARQQFALARGFWDSPRGRESLAPYREALRVRGARSVAGVVRGPTGEPVAGAEVVASELLIGDGLYFYAAPGGKQEAQSGTARAITDAAGRFSFDQVIAGNVAVGAELPAVGRAIPVPLEHDRDTDDVVLVLRPYATIKGVVRAGQTATFDLGVSSAPAALAGHGYFVIASSVDDQGRFELRVGAGEHMVFAGAGSRDASSNRFVTKPVRVRPGEVAHVEFDIRDAGVTVDISIAGEHGAPLDLAQVFVFDNPVDIRNAADLRAKFAAAARRGTSRSGFTRRRRLPGGGLEQFIELEYTGAGDKSVCIVPITGEIKDPAFAHRLQAFADELEIHCRTVAVESAPAAQSFRLEVPPMKPLPELSPSR